MNILALNCGSATVKFQLIEVSSRGSFYSQDRKLARGLIDGIGGRAKCRFEITGSAASESEMPLRDYSAAVRVVIDWLTTKAQFTRPDAVGHRIVHGGSWFTAPTFIDQPVLAQLETLCELAPLHNPASLSAIRATKDAFGTGMPMVAVFDTAFHHTIPPAAAAYALPEELVKKHEIRRYGFHGLACQFDVARYAQLAGKRSAEISVIILHLGNGASATAVRNGRSVETSMGFTPLEGLVMGTRSGDLDPGLLIHLARREDVSLTEIETWLNKKSGLLGISGRASDMRELLAARETDQRARLAVEVFCHRARKYLGAYLAVLGGADAIIFSGGIGENAAAVRREICQGMEWCGIRVDNLTNTTRLDQDHCVSAADSKITVWVIHADEEAVIARETAEILKHAVRQ